MGKKNRIFNICAIEFIPIKSERGRVNFKYDPKCDKLSNNSPYVIIRFPLRLSYSSHFLQQVTGDWK